MYSAFIQWKRNPRHKYHQFLFASGNFRFNLSGSLELNNRAG